MLRLSKRSVVDYKSSATEVLRESLFRLSHMADPRDTTLSETEAQLLENIRELMRTYRMKQADFAAKLGRSQPWVSKRMSRNPDQANKWKVEDLDALERVFQLSPWELLRPGHGRLDRRAAHRRSGDDRRAHSVEEGLRGASSHLARAAAQTDQVIITANHVVDFAQELQALAEQLVRFSDAILARHATTVSDLPPERLETDRSLGRETSRTNTKKTG